MGNNRSSEQQGDGADWNSYLGNQQINQVMGTVYTNEEEARNINIYENPTNHSNPLIESESMRTTAISMDFDLIEDSIRLNMDNTTPNRFNLHFKLRAGVAIKAYFYWVAAVEVDKTSNAIKNITPKFEEGLSVYSYAPNKLIEGLTYLNFTPKYNVNDLSDHNITIPLVLVLVRDSHPEPRSLQSVTYYYAFDRRKNLQAEEISKIIEVDGKMSSLKNIYGISKSSLNQEIPEDAKELCTICFTNPVNTMCSPCNHMCLCHECKDSLKQHTSVCPMCRTKIQKFVTLEN